MYPYVKQPLPREKLTITWITEACTNGFVFLWKLIWTSSAVWDLLRIEQNKRCHLSSVLSWKSLTCVSYLPEGHLRPKHCKCDACKNWQLFMSEYSTIVNILAQSLARETGCLELRIAITISIISRMACSLILRPIFYGLGMRTVKYWSGYGNSLEALEWLEKHQIEPSVVVHEFTQWLSRACIIKLSKSVFFCLNDFSDDWQMDTTNCSTVLGTQEVLFYT